MSLGHKDTDRTSPSTWRDVVAHPAIEDESAPSGNLSIGQSMACVWRNDDASIAWIILVSLRHRIHWVEQEIHQRLIYS